MIADTPAVGGTPPVGEPVDGADWDTAARVVRLLEVVQRFALLDFSDLAPVGEAGDDLDALAAGINMLGEELDGWNVDFNQRVAQRTTELQEFVQQLQEFNQQIGRLTEMSNLLQVADDRDEAFTILGRFAPGMLAGTSGAIYAVTGDGRLEATTAWGPHQESFPRAVAADGCFSLREPRTRQGQPGAPVRCEHAPPDIPGLTQCVPLTARGRTLGLLGIHDHDTSSHIGQASDPGGTARQRLAVAAGEQFSLAVANVELRNELRTQSIRDALAGLYNRRHLDETLTRDLRRAGRTDTPVSVLMLDIDHFKNVNDQHGHAAGDAVLIDLAEVLLGDIRGEDTACRYGGEEFTVILAGADGAEAVDRAEQIRNTIADHDFTWEGRSLGRITASFGVATSPGHGRTSDELLNAADAALYRAKSNGRNRVES